MIVAGKYRIRKKDVPGYFGDDFLDAYMFYSQYRTFGLPFSCGWAEHPAVMIELIRTFESALGR
jgi:hypothetical protein